MKPCQHCRVKISVGDRKFYVPFENGSGKGYGNYCSRKCLLEYQEANCPTKFEKIKTRLSEMKDTDISEVCTIANTSKDSILKKRKIKFETNGDSTQPLKKRFEQYEPVQYKTFKVTITEQDSRKVIFTDEWCKTLKEQRFNISHGMPVFISDDSSFKLWPLLQCDPKYLSSSPVHVEIHRMPPP